MRWTEGKLNGARGLSVYFQVWQPETPPKAVLLIVHGAGEHSARYQPLARYCTARDYAVATLDHPGHGKSEGHYGHIQRFEDLLGTLDIFQRQLAVEFAEVPFFLVGHSMGGLVSCLHLLQHQRDFAGCVLSGPAIKTEVEPGWLQMLLIRCLSVVVPRAGVLQLDASGVSRDPAVVADYANDPLVNHGRMSARMVAELFSSMQRLQSAAPAITLPLLLLHGGEDSMTTPEGSRFLYETVGSADKTLKIYPGLFHEIFNEPERQQVFADVLSWCDQRLTAS
jgi:alpha-beta hydrolase superfamily lysophospholipase